jgi:serine/threonine protein kinase
MDHREQLPIGAELVGDYRIDGVLGRGGFGVTYAATDLALSKTVAIKEYFPTEFAIRDETLTVRPKSERHGDMFEWGRKRFLDEAQTLAKFRHPGIVRVQRFFEALNTGYMVLEFEDGQSLGLWLDELGRPATQAELDGIVLPLLDALEVMHAVDFIHRDIAPDNIIIRPDGSPVLLDFGAARQAIAAETKTLTGIVKSGYSPPEQYMTNSGLQGPWTDVYALGATLYRVVTGAAPPEAPARQVGETYVPAATPSGGEYRPSFLSAIDWALKLKMAERPQSISAFREALSDTPKVSAATPRRADQQPPQRTRRAGLKWAAAALIVIAGSIGGYIAYDRLQAERQRVQDLADAQAARLARMAREAEEGRRKPDAEHKRTEAERKRIEYCRKNSLHYTSYRECLSSTRLVPVGIKAKPVIPNRTTREHRADYCRKNSLRYTSYRDCLLLRR